MAGAVAPPARARMSFSSEPGVDADPDGHPPLPRRPDDLADLGGGTDVAGIEAQAVDARFERGQRQTVVEVDVGDQGNAGAFPDLPERRCGRPVGNGQANDLGARPLQAADLGRGRPDVPGVRLGHGLDDDRRAAPDDDAADLDRACLPALEHPLLPLPRTGPGCPSRSAAS